MPPANRSSWPCISPAMCSQTLVARQRYGQSANIGRFRTSRDLHVFIIYRRMGTKTIEIGLLGESDKKENKCYERERLHLWWDPRRSLRLMGPGANVPRVQTSDSYKLRHWLLSMSLSVHDVWRTSCLLYGNKYYIYVIRMNDSLCSVFGDDVNEYAANLDLARRVLYYYKHWD